MALVIEDGSGVTGANSYATVEQAKAYAAARGLSLPAVDATVETLLVKACDFLESLESRFKGSRADTAQELAWPRADVYLHGSEEPLPNNQLPTALIKAQCQLAVDANSLDLLPSSDGREVIRRKVDVIETEYAKTGAGTPKPELTKALAILAPLFEGGSLSLRTIRV